MAKKSSSKSMRIYEALYLLDSAMTKERESEIVGLIKKTCESQGGRVLREVAKGRRRLSYAIGSHTEGQYLIVYYEAPSVTNELLRKALQHQEDIIRSQTSVLDALPGTSESSGSTPSGESIKSGESTKPGETTNSSETTKSGDATESAPPATASLASASSSAPASSSSSGSSLDPSSSSDSSPSSSSAPTSSLASSSSVNSASSSQTEVAPETDKDNG